MKSQTANERGFTLIETSIAMLVMLVVGLGASSLFLYAVRNNTGGAQRSLSMAIAQQRVENLRGVEYTDARLDFGVHPTETVVIEGTTPASTSTQSGTTAAPGYDASASGGAEQGALPLSSTSAPGSGGTLPPAGSTGSRYFQVQTQIDPFPAGAAVPTQKLVRIRVTPVNGEGAAAWLNQNPVEIVVRRSSTTPGPNKL